MNELSERYCQYAIVDIGANSVRMNIYEIDTETGSYTVTLSARSMLGLAAYAENGTLSADGRGKLFAVLREFLARANSVPCDCFSAFATASLRGLSGREKIVDDIRARLGIKIDIISGEDEALFDFEAVRARFPTAQSGTVLDMGGGSTEIIPFAGQSALSVQSLPIGCVALMKRFTVCRKNTPFPTDAELSAIRTYVRETLSGYPALAKWGGTAYLIGGTARAAAKLMLAQAGSGMQTDGFAFAAADLQKAADAAIHDAREGGKVLQKTVPDRLISILPGLAAYLEITAYMGFSDFIISAAGVREGYLARLIRSDLLRKVPET